MDMPQRSDSDDGLEKVAPSHISQPERQEGSGLREYSIGGNMSTHLLFFKKSNPHNWRY